MVRTEYIQVHVKVCVQTTQMEENYRYYRKGEIAVRYLDHDQRLF